MDPEQIRLNIIRYGHKDWDMDSKYNQNPIHLQPTFSIFIFLGSSVYLLMIEDYAGPTESMHFWIHHPNLQPSLLCSHNNISG